MAEEKTNLPDNMAQAEDTEPPPYSYPSQSYSQHPAPMNPLISHPFPPPCYSPQIPSYLQYPSDTAQHPPPCAYDPEMPPFPQNQPQYYAPLPQHQQQQQTTNMVVLGGQTQFVYAQPKPYRSFACAIVLSVLVFVFCGYIFGLVAFIIALVGQFSATDGNARVLLRVSYGFSIAGIITGAIVCIVVVVIMATPSSSFSSDSISSPSPFSFNPNCGSYGFYYDSSSNTKTCCRFKSAACSPYGSYYSSGKQMCCE